MKKFFLLLCIMPSAFFVNAQTWDGSESSNWNDPQNWTPASVPLATGNVIINSAPNSPALPGNITTAAFSMNAGSALNFNGFNLSIDGNMDINGATLTNSNGATDISITINGTGSQYVRNSTVNDNIILNHAGTGAFYEAYQGGNTYNGNATFNHTSAAASHTSYSGPSSFQGNVTVTRTVAGSTEIFENGFAALAGNFSYSNTVGGASLINASNVATSLIGGTVNITATGAANPDFTMRHIKNNTTGGTVSVQNSGTVTITNDTLKLTALNVTGFTGGGTDDFDANEVTGSVNFSDDATNTGTVYFRRSIINGSTTIGGNGVATLYEGYQGGDTFNGTTIFNISGTGSIHTCYSAPSSFLGNLTFNRTAAGSTELFENGFTALSGNFSYTNTVGGQSLMNASNLATSVIGGTVNITASGIGDPAFTMRNIKNNTTGGTISVQNSGVVLITNDTLILTAFNVTGFTGGGTDDFDMNQITGTVSFTDAATNDGTVYFRRSVINGNTTIGGNGVATFDEAYQGGNTFNGNTTLNFAGTGSLHTSYSAPSSFLGNLTINRTVAGSTEIFENGFTALTGNFSYSNTAGGQSLINSSNLATSLIGGTVNITATGAGNPAFTMRHIKNNTSGGTISVQNSGVVFITNDTLKLIALNINGFTGGGTDDFDENQVTGTVSFSDDASNTGTVYFRRSVINGNTSIGGNGTATFDEAYQGGNTFNGNTVFNFAGTGSLATSYSAPSSFLGNLNVNRTVAGSTDLFANGFTALNGNFSYINTAGGASTINTSNLSTGVVGGTVNVTANGTGNPAFTMKNIRNSLTGGTVSVQNSGVVTITNNTLLLTAFDVNGFTEGGTDDFTENIITGTVNISDDAANTGTTYLRGNVFNSDVTYTNNSAATLFESYQQSDTYNGNVTMNRNAGTINFAYSLPTIVNKNLTFNSAGNINVSDSIKFLSSNNGAIEQLSTQAIEIPKFYIAKTGSANLTLNSPVTVSTKITFDGGHVVSSSANPLILTDNATQSGATDASHVNGTVAKIGNDIFTFPIGDGTTLKTITITAPGLAADRFSAQYFKSNPSLAGYDTSAHAGSILRVSGYEYWDLKRENGTSNVTPTFTYTDPGSGQYITIPAQAAIAHWTGSTWEDLGTGSTTGTTSGTIATAAAVNNFTTEHFTFGSKNLTSNPLLDAILYTYYADGDADTFGNPANSISDPSPTAPAGYVANNTDCDDADNTVYPGAPELCDNKDNDCNGTIDDGVTPPTFYRDLDGDTFGDAANSIQSCTPPVGYVSNNTDCDDNDDTVFPGAPELCDGKDNDCDGSIDDGVGTTFYRDLDNDGFGDAAITQIACTAPVGYVSNDDDCDDNDNTVYPNAPELCDGKDNDCDGTIDDGAGTTPYYADADGDGYGDPNMSVTGCTLPPGYVSNNTDCDDNDNTIYPGAVELCDGKDNNCDGTVDEGVQTVFYADADGDGFGNINDSLHRCNAPAGYILDNTDCNDNDNTVYPGAPELCDGKDNDCDGTIDDGAGTTPYYADTDGDGFGDPNVSVTGCTIPPGYVSDNTDCDDNDNTVYPGAPELCDGKDNNCNGTVDEGVGTTFYQDQDGDGFGDANNSQVACNAPTGFVLDNTDCDDNNNTVYPGAPELIDGLDNNCNGVIDEGGLLTFYLDSDNDGFGDINNSVSAATAPPGYVSNNTDCSDTDNTIYPGAPELCDGKDNDCDGVVDDGAGQIFYADLDADGFGDPAATIFACTAPAGYVSDNTDCDDNDNTVYPGAPELCDGKDNDCDGTIDGAVSTPVVIGLTNVCPYVGTGEQLVFTIAPLPGVTGYQWTVPATVNIVSGQNTNTLTVTILPAFTSSAYKQIRVTTTSPCGTSPLGIHYLLAQYPSTPGFITGPVEACAFVGTANEAVYKINRVTAATSYTWTASAGITINSHPGGSGLNDTVINVIYGPTFTGGTITVRANNNCGTSINTRQLNIKNGITATPGLIQGPGNACLYMPSTAIPAGTSATYVIRKVVNATSYTWAVPAGATITAHPEGTNENDTVIVVSYSNSFAGGNITVQANGSCASSNIRSFNIQATSTPGTIGAITANETQACPDRQVVYSIAAPTSTNWVQWSVPVNATILSGQGSNSITVSYLSANAGSVTATPSNGCGVGKTRTLQVSLPACGPAGFAKGNMAEPAPQNPALSVQIFPNPTHTEFNINVTSVAKERIQVRVFDINGKQYLPGNININEVTGFGNNLKAGVYLVEVIQGSLRKVTRVVKF